MVTCKLLKIFMNCEKLILIIIKVRLVAYWKAVIILKEIKKPSSKFLRVWAKNKLRFEIFQKILKLSYKNLNIKLLFYPFSLASSRTLAGCQQSWTGGMGVAKIFYRGGEHFSKILKKFIKKIAKMHYFSIFFKKFNKPSVNFCACGRTTQIVGKF